MFVHIVNKYGGPVISIWNVGSKYILNNESLKAPKGQSEAVNLRKTDNTMVKEIEQKDKHKRKVWRYQRCNEKP